jgi:methylphosphotriester-DNA--protein-cysteine methyltransferase
MLSRAIAAMASGHGLALAAHIAGFADQSHLCRTMRNIIGTTPHRLLRRA